MDHSSLVRVISTPTPLRAMALAGAGAAAAAMGLVGLPVAVAVLITMAIAAAGVVRLGSVAGAALIPAVAPAVGGDWLLWLACTATAIAAAAALALDRDLEQRRASRRGRDLVTKAREQYDHVARHVDRYPTLLEACLELSTTRSFEALAENLVRHAKAAAPEIRRAQVWLLGTNGLRRLAGEGEASARQLDYVAKEARVLMQRSATGVRLHVPLRGDRRGGEEEAVRGILVVDLPDTPAGEQARELLLALGRLGGLGLAAVELMDQAHQLALHDDLTGLFGRQEFLRRLEEESARADRRHTPVVVLAIDIDHLKRINDHHGHAVGDRALITLAKVLGTRCRPMAGVACRWGGEEFACAVPMPEQDGQTALGQAEALAEAILGDLRANDVEPGLRITASIGVALRQPGEGIESLLGRADAGLYQAKHHGRDRWMPAPEARHRTPDGLHPVAPPPPAGRP